MVTEGMPVSSCTDSLCNVFQSPRFYLALILSPNSWPINRSLLWEPYSSKVPPIPIALSPMSWQTQHKVKWLTISFSFLVLLNLFIYFWFLEAENRMPFFPFSFICLHFLSLNASSPYPSCSEPNVLDDSQGLAEGSLSRYSVNATCLLVSVLGN